MVSAKSVERQLKKIHFNTLAWGRAEVRELPSILLPDEKIYECVNGIYEGGFALLVATDVRVLLVDKKPLNYLTVEDLRFDMISEIDYSHRLFGARISISTGSKNLRFTSYNQPRLRKLIGHVQDCMAQGKKKQSEHQEDQAQHLEKLNDQLREYLLKQQQHQERLAQQLQATQTSGNQQAPLDVAPVRPSPQLNDYLFAQSLLAQHQAERGSRFDGNNNIGEQSLPSSVNATPSPSPSAGNPSMSDLYAEGVQEIFGNRQSSQPVDEMVTPQPQPSRLIPRNPLEISPLSIAYSKLPMALRNRKFGRPSFHAHSESDLNTTHPAQAAEF